MRKEEHSSWVKMSLRLDLFRKCDAKKFLYAVVRGHNLVLVNKLTGPAN